MIDPQVAFDELAQFDSADEIAEYLQHLGIKGTRYSPYSCPISQFMSETTGLSAATSSLVRTFTSAEDMGLYKHNFSEYATEAIRAFIWRFDRCDYPELVALEGSSDVPSNDYGDLK